MSGTEYPKINSVFERDNHGRFTEIFACPEFEYLADLSWQWTEKVDGTNVRLHVPSANREGWATKAYQLVGGRTDNAQLPPKLLAACAGTLEGILEADAFDVDADVVLYGEGYGAGIQKGGGLYRLDAGFVLFDVRVGEWWLRRPDVEDVAMKLNLDVVPIVGDWTLTEAIERMRSPDWFASAWPGARPEGIVGRPAIDLWNRKGERIITKLKVRDFQ